MGEDELEEIVRIYFKNLFSMRGIADTNHILLGVDHCISNDINRRMTTKFKEEELLGVLNECMTLKPLNDTNIILIPKISHSMNLTNFMPISLCTFLYKVISKAVTNRFQKVLDCCIDDAQTTFVSVG